VLNSVSNRKKKYTHQKRVELTSRVSHVCPRHLKGGKPQHHLRRAGKSPGNLKREEKSSKEGAKGFQGGASGSGKKESKEKAPVRLEGGMSTLAKKALG